MNVLLKSATVFDPKSDHHSQKNDILITNGYISEINKSIVCPENHTEIELDDLTVSNGWFDASVSFGEPGYEDRETIANGIEVAAKSGFTQIGLNSNCYPLTDSKSMVNYLKTKGLGSPVNIHPIGSLTKESKGQDIAELYDMQQAGAIAFNDYKKGLKNDNLIKIALQYTQSFNGLVMSYPNNSNIAGEGVVNEGINSTHLGLKGIPALAEELQVSRDLFLVAYAGGRLHIPTISSAKSVALIREAKAKGLNVTCSVSADHLTLTDAELAAFDANYKITPPLRTPTDVKALIEGVKDGTIDFITSDHDPIDIENKKIEFSNAMDGSIGLESFFSSLLEILPLDLLIEKITNKPLEIFGLPVTTIQKGEKANLSLFTTSGKGIFSKEHIFSASTNSAYLGKKTLGKVYGTYNNGILTLA
ncbi:dihydroorotase family protein [Wenyingzhuangia sp. 2_MG-2023]|uniref:dihydroorotase n=1 Tax=Wenyingzhuangia sp. 2_MG-2023 TaxID=3062639 RepID=UPI0026E35ABF|nr:dihydroorotase [Wenyingzhuangia sp. 2_MG-2023]MDO6738253.1 dihydroorotase [Wenyingzhuangia sp. 2_MG-2023]